MPRTIELGTNVSVEDEKFETKKLDGRETLGPLCGAKSLRSVDRTQWGDVSYLAQVPAGPHFMSHSAEMRMAINE